MAWKTGEREFLIFLTLNGQTNQRRVSEAYGIVTPTINLAKDGLIERGYILLRGREVGGRGAPRKIYGLTPVEPIAAMLEGDLWGNVDQILSHWERIAPVFLRSYKTFRDKNKITIKLLGKAAHQLACYISSKDVVIFTTEKEIEGYRVLDPWEGLLWMIDGGFYSEMYRSSWESDRMRYLRMVEGDEALREGWLRWFEGEEERFRRLEEHRQIILTDQLIRDEGD